MLKEVVESVIKSFFSVGKRIIDMADSYYFSHGDDCVPDPDYWVETNEGCDILDVAYDIASLHGYDILNEEWY